MAETLDAAMTTDLTSSAFWGRRPDAVDDKASTDEDDSVTIPVLDNDKGAIGIIKVDGNPITANTSVTLGSGATINLEGKALLYDPGDAFQDLNSGEHKSDTFNYTVAGSGRGTDTAKVTVTVNGVSDDPGINHAPVAHDDYAVLSDYYPYPGPVPLPYAEADSTNAIDALATDGPIMTTLAIGEEGDPYPYPSSVDINVLANDTDPDGDKLAVAKINGAEIKSGESATLKSGAEVTLNENGSLTYSKGIIVYADMDPKPLTEQAVTISGGELVPLDPILPPEPLPYPGPFLADQFTYTATDGALSDEATVTVYRGFYDYTLTTEPVA